MTSVSRRAFIQGSLVAGAGLFAATRSFAAGSAFEKAKAAKSISVGIANEKPYGYVETDGKLTGAIIEVLRATVAPYGITEVKGTIADSPAAISTSCAMVIQEPASTDSWSEGSMSKRPASV